MHWRIFKASKFVSVQILLVPDCVCQITVCNCDFVIVCDNLCYFRNNGRGAIGDVRERTR